MKSILSIAVAVILFASALVLNADVPQTINYQGRLLNSEGAPVPDGNYEITFSIYNEDQTKLWEETLMVPVLSGLLNVTLGDINPLGETVVANPPTLFLGIKIGTDPELEPRTLLSSSPYALRSLVASEAVFAHSVAENSINDIHIVDGSISLADLGEHGATEGQIIKMGPGGWMIAEDDTGFSSQDLDWVLNDDILYTGGVWGIARPGNILYGGHDSTHVNIGVACSTGVAGLDQWYVTVGGGQGNHADGNGSTISGGMFNGTDGDGATVGGGIANDALNVGTTVAGGSMNDASALDATVAGGNANTASGPFSTVAGGQGNHAADTFTAVAGGSSNTASGYAATVPGGLGNEASGRYSFAAGRRAQAYNGCFVWADSMDQDFGSLWANEFALRAGNGIRAETNNSSYGMLLDNDGDGDGIRVYANSSQGNSWAAVFASNNGSSPGIYASSGLGYAGYFFGDINVTGTIDKSASAYNIDHPLDPQNKYLSHSTVSSPDMMNIYNGNITLDAKGEANVNLPEYFEALNRDFRYQLTAIGMPGPDLYIAEEISGNSFRIAGGEPGMRVSWQVTGIRADAYANSHRAQVETDKPSEEQGYYRHPEEYGLSPEMGIIKPSDHEKKRVINATKQ
ncbi:MAG TPA: hypothetical protein ENO22_05390 [candidate division Zixibacteria bacterium]|nr:hypothetical protein [candidate division Zixibacteria bacterium]